MRIPRPTLVLAAVLMTAAAATGCGDGFEEPADPGQQQQEGDGDLTILFGSSGEAETAAVKDAAARWAAKSGKKAEAIPAQDLTQQLGQGFAGGTPPDVFYVSPDFLRQYAEGGSLYPYGDQLEDADDFFPALRDTYTYEGELYCAPKDLSAHALVINTAFWQEAGLTDADIPTTWEQLAAVAQRLTTGGRVGLAFTGDHNPVGTFLLQGGGWYLNEDGTQVTADTPENLATLEYLKANLDAGTFAFAKNIDAKWGGEALGTGKAAMTVEGGWVVGALQKDFPQVQWKAVPMPKGPGGAGTTVFSNCWGIAAASSDRAAAVDLVKFLTSPEEQQTFATAFGATPSRQSLTEWNAEQFPASAAFNDPEGGHGPVTAPGFASVLQAFNTGLEGIAAGTADPKQVLADLQRDGEEALSK
ncbi:MAG TPA: extracellular solute-binding protein [Pseudonocardiaceae bacterium]